MTTRKTRRIFTVLAATAVAGALALLSSCANDATGTNKVDDITALPTQAASDTNPTTPGSATPDSVTSTTQVQQPVANTGGSNRIFTLTAGEQDGVIFLTASACGSAKNWQSVAADNKILGPAYVVLTGQQVKVNCLSTTKPLAPVAAVVVSPTQTTQKTAAPAPAAPSWVSPLAGKCYTSGFGWRDGRIHEGIDLPTAVGTDVRAAAAGTVHWGNDPDGAGWYITIDHGNGLWTTYFHLSARLVGEGKHVVAGQHIAESGGRKGAPGAGNSRGPHLHFEVHPWGQWTKHYNSALGANAYTNPVSFMQSKGVRISHC